MSDRSSIGARRFETFVRRSTYSAVALPVSTFLGSVLSGRGAAGVGVATAFALVLAVTAGNIVVVRWSIDTVVGRARRLPVGLLVAWALVVVAFVLVASRVPLPAMELTQVAAVASVAASFVPALGARRALVLNGAVLVLTVLFVGTAEPPLLVAGSVVISGALWACWSSAWMLRVLLELRAADEDRAALALAEERLRISRDLHDVFGRTLATIAVKSSLAAELVDRGRTEQAGTEIAGIRRVTEEAGTGLRRVVRGENTATWDDEVSGARSLLASAGIRCTVAGDPVPGECAEALAWVVREGVTNLLRHSSATQVTLATAHEDEEVLLTVANDGVVGERATGTGTGLDSLAERIGALGGRVTTRRDGMWFHLDAAVPAQNGATA